MLARLAIEAVHIGDVRSRNRPSGSSVYRVAASLLNLESSIDVEIDRKVLKNFRDLRALASNGQTIRA